MNVPEHIKPFWQQFVDSGDWENDVNAKTTSHPDARFLEAFQIGPTPESADAGVQLILDGKKTATSSLLWEFEAHQCPVPEVGSLSVVENGAHLPVCVIETRWVQVVPFNSIDEDFVQDYGETDGTRRDWYQRFAGHYQGICKELGRKLTDQTPLVCERFSVVYRRH